jgi:outer membrane lipoprotein-sorting protein
LIYFKNLFDIDDFIDYLSVMLDKTANLLHRFEYLDKAAEHLTLVVDNYIAMMLEKTIDKGDSKMELRDVKIDKLIKDNE